MSKLVVHIGTHKTGTTALQHFFRLNAALFAEQGFFTPIYPSKYPGASRERSAHFLLVCAHHVEEDLELSYEKPLLRHVDTAVFKQDLLEHDKIFLSDERLWYVGATESDFWARLRRYLESCEVKDVEFVLYLRRQDLFAFSLWNQYVKGSTRETRTFSEYLDSDECQKMLDYARGIAAIESVFGPGCVIVRIYDRDTFEGGDIYHDFCAALGIEITDAFRFPGTHYANTSLSGNSIELKRLANLCPGYKATSNFLMNPALACAAISDLDAKSMITPEHIHRLQARYEEGNAELARKYFGPERTTLFEWPQNFDKQWSKNNEEAFTDALHFFVEALCVQKKANERLAKRVKKLERASAHPFKTMIERVLHKG